MSPPDTYDNDGFQDLFVTGYPRAPYSTAIGTGTFSDVTEQAGLRNQGKLAAGAAWFDYNRDGLLHVFVCTYAEFSFRLSEWNGVLRGELWSRPSAEAVSEQRQRD